MNSSPTKPDYNKLRIIEQHPSRKRKRESTWKSAADLFLKAVPSAEKWHAKQAEVGVGNTAEYERALKLIAGCNITKTLGNLVNVATAYAQSIASSSAPATGAEPPSSKDPPEWSRFQIFVLLSFCAI